MNLSRPRNAARWIQRAAVLAGLVLGAAGLWAAEQPGAPEGGGQLGRDPSRPAPVCAPAALGSPYIPVDSWVYPAVLRLYALGFAENAYLGIRPWTRASVEHMVEDASAEIEDADDDGDPAAGEAEDIMEALNKFLYADVQGPCLRNEGKTKIESVYTVARSMSGTPLRDSFHLGSTVVNDYGRPYESGFNSYSGASGYLSGGRFVLYVRGEFQAAPSGAGYSQTLAQTLAKIDSVAFYVPSSTAPYANTTAIYSQPTIPMGPIGNAAYGRFLEAYVSGQVLNHVISFGKQDQWLGPGLGGAMAFSNNAQNFYSFEINRIEPLRIPLLSRLTGPFRYEFLLGALRGHTLMPSPEYEADPSTHTANVINPGDPWVHVEKLSFRPTEDLEFGFERTVIWGGEGHSPVNLGDFWRSFSSLSSPSNADKNGKLDPGARFGSFDFSYRLPFVRKWLTLYTDSEVHDDVSPIDAPRRAAYRPGIYLSHVPGIPKLDMRMEAASTDPTAQTVDAREYGHFMYWEGLERQGYTNQGQLFGDWIGREDKGGQAWITWHLSGNEWLQVSARNQKATKDFIPGSSNLSYILPPCSASARCFERGGTTVNDLNFQVVKRIGRDFEVDGKFSYEHWTVPLYMPGQQTVTTTNIQITWFPERKVSF